jgi:hypothetical protein
MSGRGQADYFIQVCARKGKALFTAGKKPLPERVGKQDAGTAKEWCNLR